MQLKRAKKPTDVRGLVFRIFAQDRTRPEESDFVSAVLDLLERFPGQEFANVLLQNDDSRTPDQLIDEVVEQLRCEFRGMIPSLSEMIEGEKPINTSVNPILKCFAMTEHLKQNVSGK